MNNRETYDASVSEIRTLLGRAHSAWVDVFLRLRVIDLDGLWKVGGHATFSDFLRSEFPNALGIERYTHAIQAIQLYGEDTVRRVGVASAHAMIARPFQEDAAKRELLVASIDRAFQANGVAPDVNEVRKLARGIAPVLVQPARVTQQVLRERETLSEVARLRARVRELEAENAKLKKQLAKLKRPAAAAE